MNKLIAKQHLLPSVLWLLEELMHVEQFSGIDLLFKDYSEIPGISKRLPTFVKLRYTIEECLADASGRDLLILDEGGSLHQAIPMPFAQCSTGVEQTTSGLQNTWRYPVVLVCRSAAKLLFESQIIARGIVRKLDSQELLKGKTVGIIGLGALGSAVARCLVPKGIKVVGSDIRAVPDDLIDINYTLSELLYKSDVILGCTGLDVLGGVDLSSLCGTKIFASCSSSDVEFRTLLKYLSPSKRFGTAKGFIGKIKCILLNGGFPINFDRVREWELFDEIILTRRLVLEGLVQAKSLIGAKPSGVMLDPAIQRKVVLDWLQHVPDRSMLRIPNLLTEKFFLDHSEGEIQTNKKPIHTLPATTPDFLEQMRAHKHSYETAVMDLKIMVLPGVWSPAYDSSSLFHLENMPNVKGLDFLEIGSGTGIISVYASRFGAKKVVAVDINPEAVRNTQLNFEHFSISNGEVFLSDVFSNVRGKFDLIIWNAPYHDCRAGDMLERGCADEGYRDIRTFFQKVRTYLKPGGKVIFGFSESGDISLIEALIAINGFRIKRKLGDWRQGYNRVILEFIEKIAITIPIKDITPI